ncbi:hypothetical protein GCM10007231_32260 [Nocardioides daphniae]|uniref:EamA domain-containing protein n=1 Tax=Nocardioides daphniae TaxID=402297 RepID=A0ABQ1QKI5_9ACTN|nr:hypothetical protein GCM10007231_32260 [Nocardioides daphniae]
MLALALLTLPWALVRRPRRLLVVSTALSAVAMADLGLATLRSGLGGEVVLAVGGLLTTVVLALLPLVLYLSLAVVASGWDKPAAVLLALASPPVALFYSIGSYDARPWYEAVSGASVLLAGAWLVARSVRRPSTTAASQTYEGVPTA